MADPQVVSWTDPVTGLKTSGIMGYQSGSTGGLNPTTMAQYLPPQQTQGQIPGVGANPYNTAATGTAPNPTNDGSAISYGLNPNQFATDTSAAALAKYLGGDVSQLNLTGPNNSWTPQNQINVPGSQNPINAGLGIGELQRNGSGPTDLGSYNVQRDLGNVPTGQTAAQFALSNPAFQMNSGLANSGPGYNMVYNPQTGKYVNNASGTANLNGPGQMSQADTISQMRKFNGLSPTGAPSGATKPTVGGTGTPPPTKIGPSWIPQGYSKNPTTGLLQRDPGPIGQPPSPPAGSPTNTTSLGGSGGTIRSSYIDPNRTSRIKQPGFGTDPYQVSDGSDNGGTQTISSAPDTTGGAGTHSQIDTTGLSVAQDANGAYKGSVSIGGQPTTISVMPDGRVFDTNGQDISSQFSQSDLSSLTSAFGQASNDLSYSGALSQVGQNNNGGGAAPAGGGASGGSGSQNVPPGGTPGSGYVPSYGSGNYAPLQNYWDTQQSAGVGNNPYPQSYYGPGNQQPGFGGGQPPYTGSAIDQMAQNNRNMALGQAGSLQNELNGYTQYQQGNDFQYSNMLDSAYGGIASGGGGYSDAEKQQILNNPALQSLQLSQDQANSNYLTPEEQAGIKGNPNTASDYLSNAQGGINANLNAYGDQVNGALGDQSTNVNKALTDTSTGVRQAAGQTYADMSGIQNYMNPAINNNLKDTASGVRSYVDPSKLTTSNEYNQNYNVTPQDQQNILDQAGRTVGNQEMSDEARLVQAGNAQGNMSPLAMASARQRLRQTGAINEADAMSNAAIRAKQLQLDTTQQRENTRLGAEQGYAGLGTSSNLALGQQSLGGQEYLGNLASQDTAIADQAMLGAEQYLGTQNVNAQQFLGQSKLSNKQQLANRQNSTDLNIANKGTDTAANAEQNASTRAAGIAGNRQGTNQSNQNAQYQRGQYIYGQGSQANTNFANQRLQQEQEYRNYLGGRQQQASQNQQVGQQQKLGLYGTGTSAINNATAGATANYQAKPGDPTSAVNLTGSIVNDVTSLTHGAKGVVSQGPHEALVGEAGPELIVDLAPSPRNLRHSALGDVFTDDTYGVSGSSSSGETDTEGYGLPGGSEVKHGQDVSKRSNPLYLSILRGMVGQDPNSTQWGQPQQQQQPSGTSGGGSGKSPLASIMGLFMANGGVVGSKAGNHFFGNKANIHSPHAGIPMPKVELVTHPQIRMLGQHVPQAVVPMTKRKNNRVTPEMLPSLFEKYGNYGSQGGV